LLFLQEFLDTGGRARTDTVLSHHRILSPRCLVRVGPSALPNLP
jgi:hypothetical protein